MVDLQILEKHGCTVEILKGKFATGTADGKPADEKTKGLVNLIQSRIDEGIRKSLRESRHWWALDQAFDVPFRAISPTLTKWLLGGKMDTEGVMKVSQEWGLTHLIREEKNNKGEVVKTIDIPAFFEISVPVAKAYTIIRTAVIFNERNIYPFFKYEPATLTAKNKARCDIITDRIQKMSSQYGYPAIMRQAILAKNIYGTSLMFPAECWHKEVQLQKDDKETIVKEGLRHNLPHMSRTFWDLNYRLSTFNTDTGCTYGGYWQVNRYGDVKDNENYWNTDKLTYGTNWMTANPTFFSTIYPCVMKFPGERLSHQKLASGDNAQAPVAGAGAMDREAAAGFYAADETDAAITLTQLFMKLVPKKYGWGDYPYPVWFRFVVANESTVIYAEPLAYYPIVYRGYDAHEEREINSSIVLECLPFQDHIGNLLSQQLLTIKQNLLAAVFFNEDAVGKGASDRIQNLGNKWYMEVNFIPYSSRMAQFAGKDIKEAFFPVNFPRLDTTQILAGIRSLLDMMERILVMSSQEIGAAASHEQTAEETRVIATSTSNRLKFTASYDDDADLAWKKQLYDALMAYGDEEVYAQVETTEGGNTKKVLEDLGFTVDEEGDMNTNTKTSVKGNKTALAYETFASTRDSTDRINNAQLANAMVQLLQVVFANPLMFAAIGPAQAVKLVNQVAETSGFFKEFRLQNIPGASEEEKNKQAQEQIGGMLAQLKQVLEKEMQETVGQAVTPMAQALQQLTQQVQTVGQAVPKLAQAVGQINQQMEQNTQQVAQTIAQIGQKDGQQDQTIQKLTQMFALIAQHTALPLPQGAPPPEPPPPGMPPGAPPP